MSPSHTAAINGKPGRVARLAMTATVIYPFLWLASVFVVWALAKAELGHAPRPLLDDPGTLGDEFASYFQWSVGLMLSWLPVLLGSVVAALVSTGTGRLSRRVGATWLAALCGSFALTLLVVLMNPGRVLAWYLD